MNTVWMSECMMHNMTWSKVIIVPWYFKSMWVSSLFLNRVKCKSIFFKFFFGDVLTNLLYCSYFSTLFFFSSFQGQDRHAICNCTFLFFMIALNFFLFISSLFFHSLLLVFFYIRVLTSIENFVEIFFSFWIGSSTLTFYGWFDLWNYSRKYLCHCWRSEFRQSFLFLEHHSSAKLLLDCVGWLCRLTLSLLLLFFYVYFLATWRLTLWSPTWTMSLMSLLTWL